MSSLVYTQEPYLHVELDYSYSYHLLSLVKFLTKYIRRYSSLWRYSFFVIKGEEVDTCMSNIYLTREEKRVALHILKYYNQRDIPIVFEQIKGYIEYLLYADFLCMYVVDDLKDHLAVNILMSYTEIDRTMACRCLENMRMIYMCYPNEKLFPFSILQLEAYAIDTSKISKNNYEIIRRAIDPRCKNFHVNVLLTSIIHISHSNINCIKDIYTENDIRTLFESVDIQFILAVVESNYLSHSRFNQNFISTSNTTTSIDNFIPTAIPDPVVVESSEVKNPVKPKRIKRKMNVSKDVEDKGTLFNMVMELIDS